MAHGSPAGGRPRPARRDGVERVRTPHGHDRRRPHRPGPGPGRGAGRAAGGVAVRPDPDQPARTGPATPAAWPGSTTEPRSTTGCRSGTTARLEGRTTPEIRVDEPGWTVWRGPDPGRGDHRAGGGPGRCRDRPGRAGRRRRGPVLPRPLPARAGGPVARPRPAGGPAPHARHGHRSASSAPSATSTPSASGTACPAAAEFSPPAPSGGHGRSRRPPARRDGARPAATSSSSSGRSSAATRCDLGLVDHLLRLQLDAQRWGWTLRIREAEARAARAVRAGGPGRAASTLTGSAVRPRGRAGGRTRRRARGRGSCGGRRSCRP